MTPSRHLAGHRVCLLLIVLICMQAPYAVMKLRFFQNHKHTQQLLPMYIVVVYVVLSVWAHDVINADLLTCLMHGQVPSRHT